MKYEEMTCEQNILKNLGFLASEWHCKSVCPLYDPIKDNCTNVTGKCAFTEAYELIQQREKGIKEHHEKLMDSMVDNLKLQKKVEESQDFENSQCFKLLGKISNLEREVIRCGKCRVFTDKNEIAWCRLCGGLDGAITENDFCSRGERMVEE